MRILNDLKPRTFDLHIHTTASDGVYSPSVIVEKAKEAGLTTIAITDHDTLAGVKEAQTAGERLGLNVIAGVEISTKFEGKTVDILGYHIDRIQELHDALTPYRDFREWRAKKIIEKFCSLNMPITLDDVREFSSNSVIARPHIAKAIVKKGYVTDVQTVFDRYLADGKPAAVEKKVLSPEEGIRLIRQAGGLAVLAHPVYIGDDERIRRLLQIGFDGIEVWHRSHAPEDTKRYIRLAGEFDLIVTGGSDFHMDEHRLGDFGISPK
ncbi:PHP domain-containing protein [Desmospora profundinema]|uniref:Metal-dependent phosphoesterase TrpH n=1 Tax=Desmospora profundinema TaxID=1571184 RepID=A0ABU1IMV0_9BACL|nr:PHP domain-containing protein [Desmospora profundinema]MDR6225284.1 putative metal-dependent phosphoesterase TrpH [Desmospora profundinema]